MEHLLLGLATIIVLGVGAQWLSWRLHLPAIHTPAGGGGRESRSFV